MFFKIFHSKAPAPRSVLFVCTANVTRSPVAEALFRKAVSAWGERWEAASAGTKASRGAPSNPVISFIMSHRGLPIIHHRSQLVTKRLLHGFQWIVVMESSQRDMILKLDATLEGRIFTFRELAGSDAENVNMPDPTGKNEEDFRELFNIFDAEMPLVVKALRNKVDDMALKADDDS